MKNKKYIKGNPNGGLTPITSEWMHQIFEDGPLISDLIDKFGSPINLHHLPTFLETIKRFKEVFDTHQVKHQIYYARKANKCRSLVKQALEMGIGVDTASFRELEQSIALGGNGQNLVLTSAIKTKEQYTLAINNQVPIILDNWDECAQADSIAKALGKKAAVGFRVSGFEVDGEKLYSRFGFDIDKVADIISDNCGTGKQFENLNVQGIHFHLDGYSTIQRGKALSDCLYLVEQLKAQNFDLKFIDIGGGILVNYLKEESQWEAFDQQLRDQVSEGKDNLTYKGNGLGYEKINGNVERSRKTYPYFNKLNGTQFLEAVLAFKASNDDHTNAHRLKELKIEMRIEPGRSLLNQTGMTIARVAHRKQDYKGLWLVGLEMNMSQMMSSSEDFLLDPFIIYNDEVTNSDNVNVYFTGAYCLERDILLKRKISLPKLPEIGDHVAFVNTAGYMMHFFETEAHLFELSKNLSFKSHDNFSVDDFKLDEEVS